MAGIRNSETTVLVTGGTGYLAAHVLTDLLERGYRVRATVRDVAKAKKQSPITELLGRYPEGQLTLYQADLLQPGAFDAVVEGCDYVLHTASPYGLGVGDGWTAYMQPAVRGTLSVLEACHKWNESAAAERKIKKVVLTSSMAAVVDMDRPEQPAVLDESVWNTHSYHDYMHSKAQAEKEAWAFMGMRKPSFELTTLCPMAVWGPDLTIPEKKEEPANGEQKRRVNPSNEVFQMLLTGGFALGAMDLHFLVSDVRDTARAHVDAIHARSGQRYLLVSNEQTISVAEMAAILREHFEQTGRPEVASKLPTTTMPNWLSRLVVRLFVPREAQNFVLKSLGYRPKCDVTLAEKELGGLPAPDAATEGDAVVEAEKEKERPLFRPIKQTVIDAAEDFLAKCA